MQFTSLISAEDLKKHLHAPDIVLLDARFSLADVDYGKRAYVAGHIPGAFYVHLDRDLSGPITPSTGRHPLPSVDHFVEVMREHGVSSDSQVVVYDDAGGMFASRCWWLLKWLGHERVAVLDGGLPAWLRSGGAEEQTLPAVPGRGNFAPHLQPQLLVDVEQVQQGLSDRSILLCDARAPERYRGDVEPIDKKAGHVPGAINRPFTHNLDAEGCFKQPAELARIFLPANGDSRNVVHMCGSGVTACHNLLATVVSGQPLPALYAGSWSEWITDPNRPIATGPT